MIDIYEEARLTKDGTLFLLTEQQRSLTLENSIQQIAAVSTSVEKLATRRVIGIAIGYIFRQVGMLGGL